MTAEQPDLIYRLALSIFADASQIEEKLNADNARWPEIVAALDLLCEAATKIQVTASAALAMQDKGVRRVA
jgi:hypothetical protein